MSRHRAPRHTFDAAAPQLTLAGTPSPDAQGTLFASSSSSSSSSSPISETPCPACGGSNTILRDLAGRPCANCSRIGAAAVPLELAELEHNPKGPTMTDQPDRLEPSPAAPARPGATTCTERGCRW